MNETIFSRLRRVFDPELDDLGPGHRLPPPILRTLRALLEVLADDPALPWARPEARVQRRARASLAQAREYVSGARLLDFATRRRLDLAFADAAPAQRDVVLRGILGEFPSPDAQSVWLRRLRLTSRNLHIVFDSPAVRRFRKFVVTDLIADHYSSAGGWAVVGYDEFPGFVRTESQPSEVTGISVEGRALVLELSDACFEALAPETLRTDARGRLTCRTKSGRQEAVFSRAAQLALGELLEESDEGVRLRLGGWSCEVHLDDAVG